MIKGIMIPSMSLVSTSLLRFSKSWHLGLPFSLLELRVRSTKMNEWSQFSESWSSGRMFTDDPTGFH